MRKIYFNRNVLALRKKYQLKKADVYNAIEMAKATYDELESKGKNPTLINIIKIARFYRIKIDSLIFEKLT